MPSYQSTLAEPPPDVGVDRSFWIEHAAGFVLLSDVRDYALGQLANDLTTREQQIAIEAANHALYGLMMVADGVTGTIRSEQHALSVSLAVELKDLDSGLSEKRQLFNTEGMCGWYHGWIKGDFGTSPVVAETGA